MKFHKKFSFAFLLAGALFTNPLLWADIVTVDSGKQTTAITGNDSLVKTGDGTYEITQINTYTGTTTINSGVLKIATSGGSNTQGAFGIFENDVRTGTSGITVAHGAKIQLAAQNCLGIKAPLPDITVNGGTIESTINYGHANLGNVTLNGGQIYAASTVGASGYGNFLLGGKITVTDDASITCNKVLIRDTNNGFAEAGVFDIAPGKTLSMATAVNFGEVNTGTPKMRITGGGTLAILPGSSTQGVDSALKTITISNGTLQYGQNNSDKGSLNVPLIIEENGTLATSRSAVGTYEFTIESKGGTITNIGTGINTFGAAITNTSGLTVTGTGAIQINSGMLKGSGSLTKTGSNVLTMSGANADFSGTTIIQSGVVTVSAVGALGSGSITLDGGTLRNVGGNYAFANNILVKSDSTIDCAGTGSFHIAGNLSGSGNIKKGTGGYQLHLSGDNSEYSGTVTMSNAWLGFRYNTADNTTKSGSAKATYVLNNGTSSEGIVFVPKTNTDVFTLGMINTNNTNAVVRAGADATNAGLKAINLEVGGADLSGTFAGKFLDYNNCVVNITKTGTGTWTWTNTADINAGLTKGPLTVKGGVFEVGNGGSTGHLQGFNYYDIDAKPTTVMPIVVESGGTLAFNRTDDGNLRLNQTVTFNGGTLLMEGSKNVVFNNVVKGSEMVVDAKDGATGVFYFQHGGYVSDVQLEKLTINGGTLISKADISAATAIDLNGGTLQLGNSGRAATISGTISLNAGGSLSAGNAGSVAKSLTLSGGTITGGQNLKAESVVAKAETTTLINMDYGDVNGTPAPADFLITSSLSGSGTIRLNSRDGGSGFQMQISGTGADFTGTMISNNGAYIGLMGSQASSPDGKYVSENGGNFFLVSSASDSGVFQLGDLSGGGQIRAGASNAKTDLTLQVGSALKTGETSAYSGNIQIYEKGDISLEKVGAGNWVLTGNNTATGSITVSAGTLTMGNQNSVTSFSQLNLNGGTFANTAVINYSNPVYVADGKTSYVKTNETNQLSFSGPLYGESSSVLSKSGTQHLFLDGDLSNYKGTIVTADRFITFGSEAAVQGASIGGANAVFEVGSSALGFAFTGEFSSAENKPTLTYAMGDLVSSNTLAQVRPGGSNKCYHINLEVGALGNDSAYAGVLQDYGNSTLSLTKVGLGTWTLSGNNTYTGTTTIKEGELKITGKLTGTSGVVVEQGGTLSGYGIISGPVQYASGSTFLVDFTNSTVFDQLVNKNNPLQILGNTESTSMTLKIDATNQNLLDLLEIDREITVLSGSNLDLASINLDASEAAGFWYFGYSDSGNSLWVRATNKEIPEPSTWVMLLLGGFGLLCLRRHAKTK